MSNPVMYQVRKAKKFTGTKKWVETKEVWQQFLPLVPEVLVGGKPIGQWVDINTDDIPWATPECADKYVKASNYIYQKEVR